MQLCLQCGQCGSLLLHGLLRLLHTLLCFVQAVLQQFMLVDGVLLCTGGLVAGRAGRLYGVFTIFGLLQRLLQRLLPKRQPQQSLTPLLFHVAVIVQMR